MVRGQAVMEYLLIISFVLAVMVPTIYYFYDSSKSYNDRVGEQQLENIARRLADGADRVYYLGEPSKIQIEIYLPDRVNNSFIQGSDIVFEYRIGSGITQVYSTSDAPINGTLPVNAGLHTVTFESRGDYVWIS